MDVYAPVYANDPNSRDDGYDSSAIALILFIVLTNVKSAGGACGMALKPCVNAITMEGVMAMANFADSLA